MAYSADTLAYDVITDMATKEVWGAVWIMGVKYILPKDLESMNADIKSRIWCSYRKNFRPISGTNLGCDTGWGCTLRCGQMLLAHTLLCKCLGREFRWHPGDKDPPYSEILRKFLDVRDSEYSIQMIALQGADFGRPVGQWFGPNNVAQALKKLAAFDVGSQLAIHVAMDMLVVVDDLKATACEPHSLPSSPVNVTDEEGEEVASLRLRSQTELTSTLTDTSDDHRHHSFTSGSIITSEGTLSPSHTHNTGRSSPFPDPMASSSPFNQKAGPTVAGSNLSSTGCSRLVMGNESIDDYMKLSIRMGSTPPKGASGSPADTTSPRRSGPKSTSCIGKNFRSVLLFIPLRLGQDSFNMNYANSLKACLALPQSVGFIGGKPRHALYFIGYNDSTLLFLDPHTTQPTVPVKENETIPDASYHTTNFGRMHISGLDPSIALGFFCKDENDVDDLMERLKKFVLRDSCLNMFELTEHRPAYWGPFKGNSVHASIKEPFILVKEGGPDSIDEDEEEFEIIDWPIPDSLLHNHSNLAMFPDVERSNVSMSPIN